MSDQRVRPYALALGEGWIYNYGIDFVVKAGERRQGGGVAVIELTTRSGEEPPDHTHDSEDEIFYVLEGDLKFRCGDQSFEVSDGGFVFLPRGIEHGYEIRRKGDVRLLVVTAPADARSTNGWGGFVGDLEMEGVLRGSPRPDRLG